MSLWSGGAGDARAGYPALDRERAVDVVVVGAGLAGLLTALRLHGDGAEVLVLERDRVASGVTGHTTAKVTALHGTAYQRLVAGKGVEAAAIYAAANQAGLEHIADLVATLDIDCAFTRAPAWTYATGTDGRRAVEAEVAAAQAAGLPARFGVPDELPFATAGGVVLPDQAHVQPVALCRGLAAALPAGTVHESTAVTAVETGPGGVEVHTTAGHCVGANHVVLATHTPIVDPAFLSGRMRPVRSYAAAVELHDDGAVPDGMYLGVESPTHSFRPARRDGQPVLVVGGFGHGVGDADTGEQRQRLEDWARSTFAVAEVTDHWSAHDQVTSDGVPFVGRLAPRESQRWVATGFGKWGMTTAAVAAEVIADGIAGRPADARHPATELFDATRLAPSVSRTLATTSARVARHFVGDRIGARRAGRGFDAARLGPGEGRVVHVRGGATAACRDHDGTLHTVRARCPHRGCLVAFNTADQTWDCPCHGSRFAPDGRVLQGPASTPLAEVEGD